jgi:Holliday junction resolvase RusA-like endonuclease
VPGHPKTKGSLVVRNAKAGTMREAVAGSTRWRQLIAERVRECRQRAEAWDGPAGVTAYFYLPRDDIITARAGDIDKLTRNVLDALEDAAVWADDVQCVTLDIRKHPLSRSPEGGPGLFLTVMGYEQW